MFSNPLNPSFPRRRESRPQSFRLSEIFRDSRNFKFLDSRLRANDAAGVDWFKPRQNRLTFRNIEFTNPTYALPMIGTLKSALVFKIHMYMFYFIKFYFLRASFKNKDGNFNMRRDSISMNPFGSDSFFNV